MKRWMVLTLTSALALPCIFTSAYARGRDFAVLKAAERTQKGSGLGANTLIKLSNCDAEIIRSASNIQQYLYQLCELAGFKTYGDAYIAHCGTDYSGYSAVQLLDKGHIIVHVINSGNSVHIAVACSSSFDSREITAFSQDFFKAAAVAVKTVQV